MDELERPPLWLTILRLSFFGVLATIAFGLFYLDIATLVEELSYKPPLLAVPYQTTGMLGVGVFLLLFMVSFCITDKPKDKKNQRLIGNLQTGIVISAFAALGAPLIAYPTARLVMPQLGYTYCEHAGDQHSIRFRPVYFTTTAQACYDEWLRHRNRNN